MEKSAYGYCNSCNTEHSLFQGNAKNLCNNLITDLDNKNININLEHLFHGSKGQMFGIIEFTNGETAKAFSGQHYGCWEYDNWVNPLIDVQSFNNIVMKYDYQIKGLTEQILKDKSPILKHERKILSNLCLQEIRDLYIFKNFKGETASLSELISDKIHPTGVGDCCAPKLINYAIENSLTPKSLAEFFYGISKTKQHKEFYPSCEEKCRPILGFMLCGI